jgi:hypothetical protein
MGTLLLCRGCIAFLITRLSYFLLKSTNHRLGKIKQPINLWAKVGNPHFRENIVFLTASTILTAVRYALICD